MTDTPSHQTTTIATKKLQAFVTKSLRGNAHAVWNEAAEVAEWCATDMEACKSRMLDGPEACRQMAEAFRTFAHHLEETASE